MSRTGWIFSSVRCVCARYTTSRDGHLPPVSRWRRKAHGNTASEHGSQRTMPAVSRSRRVAVEGFLDDMEAVAVAAAHARIE